jgi:hypothetical protein
MLVWVFLQEEGRGKKRAEREERRGGERER